MSETSKEEIPLGRTTAADQSSKLPTDVFVSQTAEIYRDKIAGFYDWLAPGALVRRNVEATWWDEFVNTVPNVFPFEGSLILPKPVFKASGHLGNFADPAVTCPTCWRSYRTDLFPEEQQSWLCPEDGTQLDPSSVRKRSLMLEVSVGLADVPNAALRPETAQNIFINFRNYINGGAKLPFSVAQSGRSFRNEISPRGTRLREFSQMEVEEFLRPEHLDSHPDFDRLGCVHLPFCSESERVELVSASEAVSRGYIPNVRMAVWLVREHLWLTRTLGFDADSLRFRVLPQEERPFYSGGNVDAEVLTERKWVEIIGNAYRTDHDLRAHSEASGEKLDVGGVIPHVVEPSFGLDRITLILLSADFRPQPSDRQWPLLQIPWHLAPFPVAIASVRDDPESLSTARQLEREIRTAGLLAFNLAESGRISKMYSRADCLGIPLTVTVDQASSRDGCVTVRNRDTRAQVRIKSSESVQRISELIQRERQLSNLGNGTGGEGS